MEVVVGGQQYEISGIMYGTLPAWRLIKHGGQPITGDSFDRLPEADKLELFNHVQAHLAATNGK